MHDKKTLNYKSYSSFYYSIQPHKNNKTIIMLYISVYKYHQVILTIIYTLDT